MRNENFDTFVKQALEEQVKGVEPSDLMLARVKLQAKRERRKENVTMKFGVKKIVAVAAVCLLSVTAYAATQFHGSIQYSANDITAYGDLAKAEKELGFDAKYVESFENGFTFWRGGTGATQGMDEENNPVGEKYGTLTISYQNDDGNYLILEIAEGNPYADEGMNTEGYSVSKNKFVPPDYELTEEDKALQDAGELNIAYGSQEVELKTFEQYSWQDDGLYYTLGVFDCDLGEAALQGMAAEIMK